MRRVTAVLAIILALTVGCARERSVPAPAPAEPPPTPVQTAPPAPPEPAGPAVRKDGEDLEVTGLEGARTGSWSPSGRLAVVQAKSGFYLLDTAVPTLESIPVLGPPVFWTETELLWMQDGRLQIRDLVSGEDRLLHDFDAPVVHLLRPGDTHYVASREGAIVAGALGGQDESILLETGHLIGRMLDGQYLAVAGDEGGPLWSIAPTGEKRLLNEAPAYFAQLSPDGRRALWLTGSPLTEADSPADPPLTDLWTWDGTGDPARIPLGGSFSARAEFSPDGSRVALALNEGFVGLGMHDKPGRLAVVEEGTIRPLATFDGGVGLGIWLGHDGFQFMPPMRGKTGAQTPIMRIDLSGEQSVFSWFWKDAGDWEGAHLILDLRRDATVHWRGCAEAARVDYSYSDQHTGHPLYAPPSAPYLPFSNSDGLWLKRLQRPHEKRRPHSERLVGAEHFGERRLGDAWVTPG